MSDQAKSPQNKNTSAKAEDPAVIESTAPSKALEAPKVNGSATQTQNKRKPVKVGLLWLFTLINLCVLIAICGAAYWYYTQLDDSAAKENNTLSNLESSLTQLNSRQSKLANEINTSINSNLQQLATKQQKLTETINTLNQQSQTLTTDNKGLTKRLAELSGRRPSDWLLAEANYLVNMAGRKLYLEKDIRTAMTLLQEADQRLLDLNDPSLFPVRALIAADIQSLNQVNPVSNTSVAMAIGGLIPKVAELPINTLKLPETEADEDLTLSDDVSDWRQNLSKTWRAIVGDFISIKHIDAPLEPYLAERQQWLIEQQVKHALAQAQTAVLNDQATLFRASLQQALASLVEHYKLDDASVGQFVEALQNLQNTDFTKNVPSTLQSQASLKEIIDTRIQRLFNNNALPSEGNTEGEANLEDNVEANAQNSDQGAAL